MRTSRNTVQHIRYFCKIAEYRSVSRAANELHVTQPWLSRVLRTLEEELGAKLFERKHKQMTLTEFGEKYYNAAARAVLLLDAATSSLSEKSDNIVKVYGGGANKFFDALKRFEELYPDITVKNVLELESYDSADVMILNEPVMMEDMNIRPIYTGEIILIVSSNHPLAKAKVVNLRDFSGDIFNMPADPALRTVCMSLCRMAGFEPKVLEAGPQRPAIVWLIRQNSVVHMNAESSFLYVADGTTLLHIGFPSPINRYSIVWSKKRPLSYGTETMINFLTEYFKDEDLK